MHGFNWDNFFPVEDGTAVIGEKFRRKVVQKRETETQKEKFILHNLANDQPGLYEPNQNSHGFLHLKKFF